MLFFPDEKPKGSPDEPTDEVYVSHEDSESGSGEVEEPNYDKNGHISHSHFFLTTERSLLMTAPKVLHETTQTANIPDIVGKLIRDQSKLWFGKYGNNGMETHQRLLKNYTLPRMTMSQVIPPSWCL